MIGLLQVLMRYEVGIVWLCRSRKLFVEYCLIYVNVARNSYNIATGICSYICTCIHVQVSIMSKSW